MIFFLGSFFFIISVFANQPDEYIFPEVLNEEFFLERFSLKMKYQFKRGIPGSLDEFRNQIERPYDENRSFFHKLVVREDFREIFINYLIPGKNKVEDFNHAIFGTLVRIANLSETEFRIEKDAALSLLEKIYQKFQNYLEGSDYKNLKESYDSSINSSLTLVFKISYATHEYRFLTRELVRAIGYDIAFQARFDATILSARELMLTLDGVLPELNFTLEDIFKGEVKSLLSLIHAESIFRNPVVRVSDTRSRLFDRVMFLLGREILNESFWDQENPQEEFLSYMKKNILPRRHNHLSPFERKKLIGKVDPQYFSAIYSGIADGDDRRKIDIFLNAHESYFSSLDDYKAPNPSFSRHGYEVLIEARKCSRNLRTSWN